MIIKKPKRTDAAYSSSLLALLNRLIVNRTLPLRTITVGVIESFDSSKQTATVRPGIKVFKRSSDEDDVVYESYEHKLLVNVPVVFPGGGDWHLTFPVKKGDECLLLCADRDISIWKKFGGVRDPRNAERHHSIKDAIAIVGIKPSQNPIQSFNSSGMELRNKDATTKITLTSNKVDVKGDLAVDGKITATGDIEATGNIKTTTGDITAGTISLKLHVHSGVTTGTASSGTPVGV